MASGPPVSVCGGWDDVRAMSLPYRAARLSASQRDLFAIIADSKVTMRFWISLAILVIAAVAAVLLGAAAASWIRGEDGRAAALILLSDRPVVAGLAVAVFGVLAVLLGAFTARILGASAGTLVIGMAALGFAARSGDAAAYVMMHGRLWDVLVESCFWSAFVYVSAKSAVAADGRTLQIRGPHQATGRSSLKEIAAAACALPVVWLVARSELKGQVLAATCIGSLAAGLVAQVAIHRAQAFFLAILPATGAIGVIISRIAEGPLALAHIPRGWSPLQLPMPQDYAAGALVGGVIGVIWANGMLQGTSNRTVSAADRSQSPSPK